MFVGLNNTNGAEMSESETKTPKKRGRKPKNVEAELPSDPTLLLSKPWRNFLAKFQEIETLKTSKWKEVHYLAYLTKRYEEFYGHKYALSFKGPPGKCTEIVFVKKMCAMLGTTNSRTIRSYIDWVFDEKIIPKKMKIKTLAFFMTPGLGNEFHMYWKKKNTIEKTTELPVEYKEVVDNLGLPLNTYGDLAFARSVLAEDPDNEARQPYRDLFNTLISLGFEVQVLDTLV